MAIKDRAKNQTKSIMQDAAETVDSIKGGLPMKAEDPNDDVRNLTGKPKYDTDSRDSQFSFERNFDDIDYEKIQLGTVGILHVPERLIRENPHLHFCWIVSPPDTNRLWQKRQQGYVCVEQDGEAIRVSAGKRTNAGYQYLMAIPLEVYNRQQDAIHKVNTDRKNQIFKPNKAKGQMVQKFDVQEISEEGLSEAAINAAVSQI